VLWSRGGTEDSWAVLYCTALHCTVTCLCLQRGGLVVVWCSLVVQGKQSLRFSLQQREVPWDPWAVGVAVEVEVGAQVVRASVSLGRRVSHLIVPRELSEVVDC